jgi:hypothetical protein
VSTLQITYALHAVGLAIGALGASTIVGSFIFGWPSIIAVVINYVKRHDAKGTWLESHFQWQIRTFWSALLASVVIGAVGAVSRHRAGGLCDLGDRVLHARHLGDLSHRRRLDATERSSRDCLTVRTA